jgi:SAM-dependent methyltransferase
MRTQVIRIYRLIPPGLRKMISRMPLAGNLRRKLFESHTALHDQFYTEEYYDTDMWFADGPGLMFKLMNEQFHPASVVDVGCGTGDYLKAFCDAGIEGHGIELAAAALKRCHEKGLDVIKLDLVTNPKLPWKADLVYSFEVAEHLPESAAAGFVKALTTSAQRGVVISAAAPGQPGLCHLNCRAKPYWIELFHQNGFAYDETTTTRWQDVLRAGGRENWLFDNLMVYQYR